MFFSRSQNLANLSRDFPDFHSYRVVAPPLPDGGRKGGFVSGPSSGFVLLSSQTRHPDAAWLWMDWFSSRGYHERMVKELGQFSVFPELNTPANIGDPLRVRALQEMTKKVVLGVNPASRNPQVAQVVLKTVVPNTGDVLVGIYTGQISDWKQALVDLDKRKQAALEDAIQAARAAGLNVSLQDYVFPDWDPMKDYAAKPNQ